MLLSHCNNRSTLVFQQSFIIKSYCIYTQLLDVTGNTSDNVIHDPKGCMLFLFSKTLEGSMTIPTKTGLISRSEYAQSDS